MSENRDSKFHLRRHKRATVRLPVMLIHEGKAHEAQMRELSRGGALVESELEVPAGTALHLGFKINGVDEVIELPVTVLYTANAGEDSRLERNGGIGLRFEEIDEKLAGRIDTYVKDQRFFGPYSTLLKEFQKVRDLKLENQ